jgi:hypothetical protein
MKLTVEIPSVGGKRLAATISLASTATALWIGAPAYLPFAVVSWQLVVVGFLIPFSVGWVTLLLMERRIVQEAQSAKQAHRERATAVAR